MKILHITKKYPDALGGDAVVVSNLEKQQKLNGHGVVILTSNCDEIKNDKNIYKFGLKDTATALDNITPKRLASLIMLFFKAYQVFKTERPDIIHTHSIDMAFFISFASRRYKIPIFHTFHIVTFNDPLQQGIRSMVELFFLRHARPRKIFVLNPDDIKDFEKAGFNNVVLITNGVNIEDWQVKGPVCKNEKFTFIAVGRLEEQKGFTYLINAAAKLRNKNENFQVQIAGEGSLKLELQKQIDSLKLQNHVFLLGRKSPNELKKLYAAANVFILPSLWEGMPLSLLEAWAAGLPTIATKVNSVPYIAHGAANLISSSSANALFSAMNEFLKNSSTLKRYGDLGLEKVYKFSWKKVADNLAKEYQKA